MNAILGSGIIGLLAKEILHGDWTVIPFGSSRFFSFNPPLDENFIIRDNKIDEFIFDNFKGRPHPGLIMRGFSVVGDIIKPEENRYGLVKQWLFRRFGGDIPAISETYMMDHLMFGIYDIRVHELYRDLVKKNLDVMKAESAKGNVTKIGPNYIERGEHRDEFDIIVSTIPLKSLLNYIGLGSLFIKYRDMQVVHIRSNTLDFEGCNQLLVVDPTISFFKVDKVARNEYFFYFNEEVKQPAHYLMNIIGSFDMINGTTIPDALIFGNRYIPPEVTEASIYCVGSYAENDWCADIASSIIRLLKFDASGFSLGN